MLDPCNSFLDSDSEVSPTLETVCGRGADGEEFAGDLDVTGTLFATLLTDLNNSDNTDICSEMMSSNSDAESDDFFDYLAKTEESDSDKNPSVNVARNTRSCTNQASSNGNKSNYSRPPLMCSTNVNLKSPRVDITRVDGETLKLSKQEKCMNRSAILARENREKKKQYMKQVEAELEDVKLENFDLKTKFTAKSKLCDSLQKEVHYLRNVLANQSCISSLLKNIHATRGVAFTSSLSISEDTKSQKRPLDENDNYENSSKGIYVRATGSHKKMKNEPGESPVDCYSSPITPCPSPDQVASTGGVCLHVSNNRVSLEMCSQCAENASNAWKNSGDHTYFKS